jgi:Lipopolysaccharide-assembly
MANAQCSMFNENSPHPCPAPPGFVGLRRGKQGRGETLRTVGWFLAAALLLNGCAGYQLGPTNGLAAGEKSIQIRPFINQTLEPRLTDAVTMEMRRELQQDGTFRLATHGDADVIVTGTLITFRRTEVTLATSDVLTVRDFRLGLTAQVRAVERSTGRVLLDKPVTGYTLIRVGADLTSAERQGLPLLADDLAKNATALLVEGKW